VTLSREARLMSGLTLLVIPTIMYGGLVLLGMLSHGGAGMATHNNLNPTQMALFRAGHAHAGVWIILSLVIQVLLDGANLAGLLKWAARIGAPLAAVLLSGGFFGLAFSPAFAAPLYLGATLMALVVLSTGVGLLRRRPA
jgi:hypothetical protein